MIRFNFRLDVPLSTISGNLREFTPKLDLFMAAVVERQAAASTGFMKSNAPWRDRTGNARAGLHATTQHAHLDHSLTLAHGVPYGIWLELRWAGRLAIIGKSMQQGGQEAMSLLQGGMARL